MRKLYVSLLGCLVAVIAAPASWAQGVLHEGSWDYLFGNHIDTHQESKLKPDGSLQGRVYIIFTGDYDLDSGLQIARHPRGAASQGENRPDEVCGVDVDCVVGWNLRGVAADAKFLSHTGVNGDDHAIWLVNRAEIPMPGSYTHFHWIANKGPEGQNTDVRTVDEVVDKACDKNNASQLETQSPSAVDEICQGWFLELSAIRKFAFEHGGEFIPVRPGEDNASHVNIVTNYQHDLVITPTR